MSFDRLIQSRGMASALERSARILSLRARRIAPAVVLTVLAPVVAEFLLGDFTIKDLSLLLALLPLYGCGALLIREVARRTGRGWPAIVWLGMAYSLLEEGFLTQSLFNPIYAGQRLLDYGYIPALGTSFNWSVFVLSIHVVWSVATPILISEGVASARRTQSWLKTPGLVITSMLFVVGCAGTASFSLKASPFLATRSEFLAVGLLVLLAIVGAFTLGSRADSGEDDATTAGPAAPKPLFVFLTTFAFAMLFMSAEAFARERGLPPFVSVIARLACEGIAAATILWWSRMRKWTPAHYLALAAGTTLTYTLFGLAALVEGHTNLGAPTDRIDIAGQIVLASGVFLLIWWGARRNHFSVSTVVAGG
jgi:hypothetical protein